MVNGVRLKVHAAVGTRKMASVGMIAGKARLYDPFKVTFFRNGSETIDSLNGTEHVEVDTLMAPMRTYFTFGEIADMRVLLVPSNTSRILTERRLYYAGSSGRRAGHVGRYARVASFWQRGSGLCRSHHCRVARGARMERYIENLRISDAHADLTRSGLEIL